MPLGAPIPVDQRDEAVEQLMLVRFRFDIIALMVMIYMVIKMQNGTDEVGSCRFGVRRMAAKVEKQMEQTI